MNLEVSLSIPTLDVKAKATVFISTRISFNCTTWRHLHQRDYQGACIKWIPVRDKHPHV